MEFFMSRVRKYRPDIEAKFEKLLAALVEENIQPLELKLVSLRRLEYLLVHSNDAMEAVYLMLDFVDSVKI
jgi:hypothetical protein